MREEDVPALMRCFERCYGTSYVDGDFYDEACLRARVASGRLRSIVVEAAGGEGEGVEAGEIVGHMGLSFREEEEHTADAGNTVVDPRMRGSGLAGKVGVVLIAHAREQGLVGFHHYPTTAHPVLQQLSVAGVGVETGIMLDYIPADTEYREMDAPDGALAVTVVYEPLAPAPARRIFVPPRYRDTIEVAVGECGLERQIAEADGRPSGSSVIEAESFERRGLHRITLKRVGSDVEGALHAASTAASLPVLQLDLPLGDAAVTVALDAARELGFRFSAVFPEYDSGDVLRLQRTAEPDWEALRERLVTPGGKHFCDLLRADFEDQPRSES